MKINVIGMILNNAGRRSFEGSIIGDDGKPMSAADSLHTLMVEYAKVFNGGQSDVATVSREVTIKAAAAPVEAQPEPAKGVESRSIAAIMALVDVHADDSADLARNVGTDMAPQWALNRIASRNAVERAVRALADRALENDE